MSLVYQKIASKTIAVADTDETFYTVSASQRVVGQIIASNTSTTQNRNFRLAVVENGGSLSADHFLAFDIILTPGEIVTISGLTLGAGDFVVVRSDAISSTAGTGMTFQLYGELDDNVI